MPKASSFSRFTRGVRHTVRAFASTKHPVLVHIVPMRRCNLACTYCNEYDKTSEPVAIDVMLKRIDKLAEFGTSVITISGGEPMMHPQIYEIIARIRHHGMIAGLISNGYYFQPEKIKKLNEAGLDYLQISIDNVNPDDVSKKSLKVLDGKSSKILRDYAKFKVNINSVVGGGVANPEEALIIANRAVELGFSSTVGVIHDEMTV
jgi:MoaA/NifB/PqqE/SkfB family radical SAM enzyme